MTSVEKFAALGLQWQLSSDPINVRRKGHPIEYALSPNDYEIKARLRVYPNGSAWWIVYGVASSLENTGEANAKELACTAVLKRVEVLAAKSEKFLNARP